LNTLKNNIKIYPNPAKNKATIELLESYSLINEIKIIDINGNIILYQQNIRSSTCILNTESLAKGLYIINTKTTDKKNLYKLLIIN